MAASDRVGWNDLKATKVFSPFPRLSEYDGTMTAPEEEEAPPAEDVPDVAPEERNDDVVAEAPSNVTANDRVPRNDADLSQPVAMDEQKPSAVVDEPVVEEVPVREEVAVETPAATEKAADKEPVAMVRPKDGPPNNIQVKPQQKDAVASVTETKETAKPTNSIISTTPAPKAATDDSCDVPTKLEPKAMLGKLTKGQINCLEERLNKESKQTSKDKISRILMANAYASGDKRTWENR